MADGKKRGLWTWKGGPGGLVAAGTPLSRTADGDPIGDNGSDWVDDDDDDKAAAAAASEQQPQQRPYKVSVLFFFVLFFLPFFHPARCISQGSTKHFVVLVLVFVADFAELAGGRELAFPAT